MAEAMQFIRPINEKRATTCGTVQFINGVSVGITPEQLDYLKQFKGYKVIEIEEAEPQKAETPESPIEDDATEQPIDTFDYIRDENTGSTFPSYVGSNDEPTDDDWPTADWTNRQIIAFAQEKIDQGDGRFNDVLNAKNKAERLEALSHLKDE